MGEKRRKVYEALLEGATQGHSDRNLYDFVQQRCPKTSSKKIVRASLLALTDPDLKDGNILSTIYALAIKHRLDQVRSDEIDREDDDDPTELAPSMSDNRSQVKSKPAEDLSV
ncbi:hypothetical protein ACQKP1_24100 [Allorhizobium sp. NPDC080224]|uniref:hypothetical protein n=1 Tax=Allorhizobium sp. NPDC080224 TaxID=3390547 RepID=UPI003D06B8A1